MVDDPSRAFLGRRTAAAVLTAASASYFFVHALGASPGRVFSFAAACGLLAAALGFARRSLTGQVVYSGAAWYHPTYRGRQLSAIFPK